MKKIYENALIVLFKSSSIAFDQLRRFPVFFRSVEVGEFIPDLIAFGSVIVDTKVIERISDYERGQMLNYLRITKLRVGLILNSNMRGWNGNALSYDSISVLISVYSWLRMYA